MRVLRLINTILIILSLALIINIFYPLNAISGLAVYRLDFSQPKCTFYNGEEYIEIDDIEQCCYDLQKQLICEQRDPFIECYVTKTGTSYIINSKTFNYCKKEGYDVEKN